MSVDFYAVDYRQPPVTRNGFSFHKPFEMESDINLANTNARFVLDFLGLYSPDFDIFAEFDLVTWNRAWMLAHNQFESKVRQENVPADRVDYLRRQLGRIRTFITEAQKKGANVIYVS